MTVLVREERPDDREASLAVERAAFETDEETGVVVAVRDEEGSFALVAEEDGEVVGHAQFSRAWVGQEAVLALGPVAIAPARQGRGIGSELIRAGLEGARERGEAAVIVLGDPVFYPRFGFEPALGLGLRNPFAGVLPDGFEIREEDFMVAVLDDRARGFAGEVRWHPAFGQGG
ncbi:MAG TPA: N-acetyltransferase [Actinomycetota bacterium]|nr:N-acetyltransferase [Actinomycetota bacterium]